MNTAIRVEYFKNLQILLKLNHSHSVIHFLTRLSMNLIMTSANVNIM